MVATALSEIAADFDIKESVVSTEGDKRQGTDAAAISDKFKWVDGLEQALLANEIQLAVHSGKDIPALSAQATRLRPVLTRENPRDIFIGKQTKEGRKKFSELSDGALVGTASVRRKSQLLRLRDDIHICAHRGNVPTRIKKLDESDVLSGIVIAAAGPARLKMQSLEFEEFSVADILPAVNQGILVVQYSKENDLLDSLLDQLCHRSTELCFEAERSCVLELEADCYSSVGIYAEIQGDRLNLFVRILSADGARYVDVLESDWVTSVDTRELGKRAASKALKEGGLELLEECRHPTDGFVEVQ
jgi:hydroxymethylbilane synthase